VGIIRWAMSPRLEDLCARRKLKSSVVVLGVVKEEGEERRRWCFCLG